MKWDAKVTLRLALRQEDEPTTEEVLAAFNAYINELAETGSLGLLVQQAEAEVEEES